MPCRLLDLLSHHVIIAVSKDTPGKLLVPKLNFLKYPVQSFKSKSSAKARTGLALSLLLCVSQATFVLPALAEVGENHFQLPVNGTLDGGESVFHVGATDTAQSAQSRDSGSGSGPTASESEADAATANMLVDDVKIEGNRLIPTEEITTVVKTRKGDKYDKDQVINDLKAIDGMGYFNKNSLQVSPEVTPSGLLLKIRVEENAPITQFAITGNRAISTEEISKLFNDQLGRPQNLNALSSAITKVEDAYKDRGFVLAPRHRRQRRSGWQCGARNQ